MRGAQSARQLFHKILEGASQRFDARNDHVIMIGARLKPRRQPQRLPQAPADAVAHNRVANFARHREAEARFARRRAVGAGEGLKEESAGMAAAPARDALELRAAFET